MPAEQEATKEKEVVKKEADPKKPADNKQKPGQKKKNEEDELSPEDLQLKQELELLVERARDADQGVQKLALESLRTQIRSATSSMTSVPKPLKFLRPHYPTLVGFYENMMDGTNKTFLSDILSVLAMTMGKEGARESLKYKLTGSNEAVGSWGHEYVRNLSGEIGAEFDARHQDGKNADDLLKLVDEIVPFDMEHNAEPEACDLLLEVDKLDKITQFVDENNYSRVCLYLLGFSDYFPQDAQVLRTTVGLYQKVKDYPNALRVAIRIGDNDLIRSIYESSQDPAEKKQLAFLLARHRLFGVVDDNEISDVLNHTNLSESFLVLARDLDIVEAKTPEDIYKSNSGDSRPAYTAAVDSARQNLASTFVNAFVNAGFGQDKLMIEDGNKWLYKNKEHGMMSAAASLGMILLWDVDGGLSQIDKYLYSNEDYVKAGALFAVGLVNAGVRNDCDPALALLTDHITNSSTSSVMRVGAVLGLGIAYAGSARKDVAELLLPILEESGASIELIAQTALALGMVYTASCDNEAAMAITQVLMEKDEATLNGPYGRFLMLGLGLIFLGKQNAADVTVEALKTISGVAGQCAVTTLEMCAYAGTGNVLKVQSLLHTCSDHLEENNAHQALAVLGISLVAMGEELGSEMALRSFDHLLQYGEPVIRRAVPLALGLISVSYPRISVMDTLSKLSHDHDADVAQGAILGLGLIGAGSNNARVAGLLRGLAQYYYKDANHLFVVRIAQGLLHMGKGTITLNPFHSDRLLMSPVAVGGLLTVLFASLDLKNLILSKAHYLLYTVVSAMFPRMLMTFNEDLEPLNVSVRVGQAVDTVGQAGKPKTITGFQTHTTPVLLGYLERAELATDDYIPVTSVLEGFTILKPNPNATPKPKVAPAKK